VVSTNSLVGGPPAEVTRWSRLPNSATVRNDVRARRGERPRRRLPEAAARCRDECGVASESSIRTRGCRGGAERVDRGAATAPADPEHDSVRRGLRTDEFEPEM
jgi:hypothetical protein